MKMKKLKVFEAFAGIGTQTLALKCVEINHEVFEKFLENEGY